MRPGPTGRRRRRMAGVALLTTLTMLALQGAALAAAIGQAAPATGDRPGSTPGAWPPGCSSATTYRSPTEEAGEAPLDDRDVSGMGPGGLRGEPV